MKHISESQEETKNIAKKLINENQNGGIFCLYGELGAGKTTFVKGAASALGIEEKLIKSPTFTILREYELANGRLLHYDFYRDQAPDHILLQQFEENCQQANTFVIIEWADNIAQQLPSKRIDIHMQHISENKRSIEIESYE